MLPFLEDRSRMSDPWFLAEGYRQQKPVMTRGRRPETVWPFREDFPDLLCVDFFYPAGDDTGLPTAAQYVDIESFEAKILDQPDFEDRLLVLVQTGSGKVTYYLYVDNPQEVADDIGNRSGDARLLEFSSGHDPTWTVYRSEIERLGMKAPTD